MGFFDDVGEFFTESLQLTSNGNKIKVHPERKLYIAGETVRGVVRAEISNPVECEGVVLKVTGLAKTEWTERKTRHLPTGEEGETIPQDWIEEYGDKKTFFKEKLKLSDVDHMLPPGYYEYPFEWTLPADLPGCFKLKMKKQEIQLRNPEDGETEGKLKCEAKVQYKLKATFESGGFFMKDLKDKEELTVNARADESTLEPAHAEKTGNVMTCCCWNRGEVELKCKFDRGSYAIGDTVVCSAEIDNKSDVDVTTMNMRLNQLIELRDKDGHSRRMMNTVSLEKYQGVAAHTSSTQTMTLPIHKKMLPTTYAKLIRCEYRLDCECDVPWARDIEAHLPVQIYAPQPVGYE